MYTLIWTVLLVGFVVVEAITVTMVSAWFAVGALVAMLASALHAPLWLQIVLFLLVSVVSLALLRPFAKKIFNKKIVKTNVDSVLGKTGIVTEAIDNVLAQGQVKVDGMEWTARSTAGTKIQAETLVKVDRVEGVKVYVTPTAQNG